MRAPITIRYRPGPTSGGIRPSEHRHADENRGARPFRRCTPLARGRDGLIIGALRRRRRGGDGSSRPRKSGARARSCSSRSSRSRRSSSELSGSQRSAAVISCSAPPKLPCRCNTSANRACASALCGSSETACSHRVRASASRPAASALRASATPCAARSRSSSFTEPLDASSSKREPQKTQWAWMLEFTRSQRGQGSPVRHYLPWPSCPPKGSQ